MSIITTQRLSGKLTVVQTANGPQVEYNGHPLYTYVGDQVARQATGQGLGGIWFAAETKVAVLHW